MKICPKCKRSRENKDFIGQQTECYKCVYRAKKGGKKKRKGIRNLLCGICQSPLPTNRWKYCTSKCSKIAKAQNVHWTLTFQRDPKDYKHRFNGRVKTNCEY